MFHKEALLGFLPSITLSSLSAIALTLSPILALFGTLFAAVGAYYVFRVNQLKYRQLKDKNKHGQ